MLFPFLKQKVHSLMIYSSRHWCYFCRKISESLICNFSRHKIVAIVWHDLFFKDCQCPQHMFMSVSKTVQEEGHYRELYFKCQPETAELPRSQFGKIIYIINAQPGEFWLQFFPFK